MAQRRMFSKTITNSSQFLMMPSSSQNLYFHLGMNADDDGFCEHFTVMRMTDSKPDDMKILQAKGFVHVFDDRVLVILQWKENNYLRSDRYTPSKYLDIYRQELLRLPSGIPTGDTGKVSIGKDSKEKGSRFQRPTPEEIQAYLDSIGCSSFTGVYFFDKNESTGWVVGTTKKPMKDWKAVCRTWMQNDVKRKAEKAKPKNMSDYLRAQEGRSAS